MSYQNTFLTAPVRLVFDAISEDPEKEWRLDEVASRVERDKKYVGMVLSYLEENRFVTGGQFSKRSQSVVNLTDEQREVLMDLIKILDGFQKQDPESIARGRNYASHFLSHSEEVAMLMAKAREHSPLATRRPRAETRSNILSILQVEPHITAREIIDRLREHFNQNLSLASIDSILENLLKDNEITFVKKRTGRSFSVQKRAL